MNKIEEIFRFDKKHYLKKIESSFPDFSLIMSGRNPVIIYGAARLGLSFKDNLQKHGIPIAGFADTSSDKWNKQINGLNIFSPNQLKKKYFNYPILVASLIYETEITAMLNEMGFKYVYPLSFLNLKNSGIFSSTEYFRIFDSIFEKESFNKIKNVYKLLRDDNSKSVYINLLKFRLSLDKNYIKKSKSHMPQYFDPDILQLTDREVFLDCGAYSGDTVEAFCKTVSNKFDKIYSFEPDLENYKKLYATSKRINPLKIIPINKGVYKKDTTLIFNSAGTIDSRFGTGINSSTIPVISLDNFIQDKEIPDFIKMDIEGAEIDALLGAKNIIQKYKPKLAISIYHRAADLWEIPELINKLNSDYKLYIRHYTDEIIDTVCYAV